MTTETLQTPPQAVYPVTISAEYPESSSKLLALAGALFFVKGFLLIPHLFLLFFVSIAAFIVGYFALWAVAVTGKYPRSLFDFGVGVQNWNVRVRFWYASWVDEYPPFGFGKDDDYPVRVVVEYPKAPSRLLALLGALFLFPKLILAIPHLLVLYFVGAIVSALQFVGYLLTIFSGVYPKTLFDVGVQVEIWNLRVSSWIFSWVDEYPPFKLEL